MAKPAETIAFDKVTNLQLTKTVTMLRAITHPLRLKLIGYIDKNKEVNVNKIYSALNLEQSLTSQHLKILRQAGCVITRRKGKFIYYGVNYELIKKILSLIETYKIR
ncbi:MAG: ArsR/SmtB family transcription factor [Chitinophagales bacterium]